jgi:hypothetical protein
MQQKTAHKRRHCPCPVRRMKGMQDAIKQMPMYEGMRKQHQRDKSAVGECWVVDMFVSASALALLDALYSSSRLSMTTPDHRRACSGSPAYKMVHLLFFFCCDC